MRYAYVLLAGMNLAVGIGGWAHAQSLPQCVGSICVGKAKTDKSATAPMSNATTSSSGEYEKNGRPCVDGLCLGDGLEELSKIKWDVAMGYEGQPSGTRPLSKQDIGRSTKRYRGDLNGVIGYLEDFKFDNAALPLLAKVIATCEPQYSVGTYTSAAGNPTTVKISLTADPANPAEQSWRVISIGRKIPSAASGQQMTEANAMLEQRYSLYTLRNRPRTGAKDMYRANSDSGFQFTLFAPAVQYESGVLKQHPACGGNGGATPSID